MSEVFRIHHCKNGETVVISQLREDHVEEYHAFLNSLDEETKLYLKYDVSDIELVRERLKAISTGTRITLVARTEAKQIVGSATVYWSKFGWKAHIGKLRVVVHPHCRCQGLAQGLTSMIFTLALEQGLTILAAQFRADDAVSQRLLQRLGFKSEALLKNHIHDKLGCKHDLRIMVADLHHLVERFGVQ